MFVLYACIIIIETHVHTILKQIVLTIYYNKCNMSDVLNMEIIYKLMLGVNYKQPHTYNILIQQPSTIYS